MDMTNILSAPRGSWRVKRPHSPPPFGDYSVIHPIPPTRFFDQLSFIGDSDVGSFILETGDGLAMIDCGWSSDERVRMIESGIRELGLHCEDLKVVIITHGHGDHWGRADYFREKYGAVIYMSRRDYEHARDPIASPRRQIHFEVYDFLGDGDELRIGDVSLTVVSTPGHTPGCLSLIIPVTDEGRLHHAALWGGTGISAQAPADRKQAYLDSLYHFREVCREKHVDVEISAHPFVYNTELKLQLCREIVDGVANPFVIGEEAYSRYEDMFIDLVKSKM